jgi:hypothetical protein
MKKLVKILSSLILGIGLAHLTLMLTFNLISWFARLNESPMMWGSVFCLSVLYFIYLMKDENEKLSI